MKPLDFVKIKNGSIGMITEVYIDANGTYSASIEFLKPITNEKTAWWDEDEFEIIDNLPDLLSRNLCHPMGNNSYQPFL